MRTWHLVVSGTLKRKPNRISSYGQSLWLFPSSLVLSLPSSWSFFFTSERSARRCWYTFNGIWCLQLIIEQAAWDSKTCGLLGHNSVIFLNHSTITISSSLAYWVSDWTWISGEIKSVNFQIEKVDILERRLCHWFGPKVFLWQSWYFPGSLFCHQRRSCHQASI